jgi:hypothetical protein
MSSNQKYLVKQTNNFFLNWQDFLLKTNLFVGPSIHLIRRSNYVFIKYFRFKKSILNLYLLSFNIKKFFNFLKFFSYKYFKYQSFFFCMRDSKSISEFKKIFASSFFFIVDLNLNPGFLSQYINRLFIKPRFIFYLADKHGFEILNAFKKLGVPIYSFNSFFYSSSLFTYNFPINYNYSFLYSFFFYFFFLFFKRDRFLYFYNLFISR